MISKVSLIVVASLIGLSYQQACVTSLDCRGEESCYSVACTDSAPIRFQQCLSDISLLAVDCIAQPVSQIQTCATTSDCLGEDSCCMIQTCFDQQSNGATGAVCGTKELLGAFEGGCQWESFCLDYQTEITDEVTNGTYIVNGTFLNGTFLNGTFDPNATLSLQTELQDDTTTFDFSSYTCDTLTCEDYTSLIGTPTCCATIENCQEDTSYNGGYFCVPSYDAFGVAGEFMDPDCTATCNDPDYAICTSTTYSGDATSECEVYGSDYCCMVLQDADGSGAPSSYGTCNKEKDVSKDQKDGEPVLCGAVHASISSFALLVSYLLF